MKFDIKKNTLKLMLLSVWSFAGITVVIFAVTSGASRLL